MWLVPEAKLRLLATETGRRYPAVDKKQNNCAASFYYIETHLHVLLKPKSINFGCPYTSLPCIPNFLVRKCRQSVEKHTKCRPPFFMYKDLIEQTTNEFEIEIIIISEPNRNHHGGVWVWDSDIWVWSLTHTIYQESGGKWLLVDHNNWCIAPLYYEAPASLKLSQFKKMPNNLVLEARVIGSDGGL